MGCIPFHLHYLNANKRRKHSSHAGKKNSRLSCDWLAFSGNVCVYIRCLRNNCRLNFKGKLLNHTEFNAFIGVILSKSWSFYLRVWSYSVSGASCQVLSTTISHWQQWEIKRRWGSVLCWTEKRKMWVLFPTDLLSDLGEITSFSAPLSPFCLLQL